MPNLETYYRMSGGGESEYQRCLHEAGNCGWHCPYCKEENDDEDELDAIIPIPGHRVRPD